MSDCNTQISNTSHLSDYNVLREDQTHLSVPISQAFTTASRPVILVTYSVFDGSENSFPGLVVESELCLQKQRDEDVDYLDHKVPLKAIMTQMQDKFPKFARLIPHAAAEYFEWDVEEDSDGIPKDPKLLSFHKSRYKEKCPSVTKSIGTILVSMMFEERETFAASDWRPNIRYVEPKEWKKVTKSSNLAISSTRTIEPKRAHEKTSPTAYRAMIANVAQARRLSGISIYWRNRDGSLTRLAGEGLPSSPIRTEADRVQTGPFHLEAHFGDDNTTQREIDNGSFGGNSSASGEHLGVSLPGTDFEEDEDGSQDNDVPGSFFEDALYGL